MFSFCFSCWLWVVFLVFLFKAACISKELRAPRCSSQERRSIISAWGSNLTPQTQEKKKLFYCCSLSVKSTFPLKLVLCEMLFLFSHTNEPSRWTEIHSTTIHKSWWMTIIKCFIYMICLSQLTAMHKTLTRTLIHRQLSSVGFSCLVCTRLEKCILQDHSLASTTSI